MKPHDYSESPGFNSRIKVDIDVMNNIMDLRHTASCHRNIND